MKSINGRLSKLEHRLGIAKNKLRFVLILDGAGSKRALSDDNCIQIVDEAGLLHTGGFGLVDLTAPSSAGRALLKSSWTRRWRR
jgi:hypothetical protein